MVVISFRNLVPTVHIDMFKILWLFLKFSISFTRPVDEQFLGICNLQQSSQQAEDALSQGMEVCVAAVFILNSSFR